MNKPLLFFLLNVIPLLSFAQPKYKDGYYYDQNYNKYEGQIKLLRASFSVFGDKPTSIKFKKAGQKTLKLKLEDMKGFVIEQDSFALISNFKINSIQGSFEKDFVEVIETGKINLYMHYSSSSDGQFNYLWDRYVLNKRGSNNYFGIYNWVKHKRHLLYLIQDNPKLSAQLKNMSKKEWVDKIPFIVREYNGN